MELLIIGALFLMYRSQGTAKPAASAPVSPSVSHAVPVNTNAPPVVPAAPVPAPVAAAPKPQGVPVNEIPYLLSRYAPIAGAYLLAPPSIWSLADVNGIVSRQTNGAFKVIQQGGDIVAVPTGVPFYRPAPVAPYKPMPAYSGPQDPIALLGSSLFIGVPGKPTGIAWETDASKG